MKDSIYFIITLCFGLITQIITEQDWKPVHIQPEQIHISLGGKKNDSI